MIVMTALDEMLATLRAHMACGANSHANQELYRELTGFVEVARAENIALRARLETADKLQAENAALRAQVERLQAQLKLAREVANDLEWALYWLEHGGVCWVWSGVKERLRAFREGAA